MSEKDEGKKEVLERFRAINMKALAPDIERLVRDVLKKPEKLLYESEEFNFNPNICLSSKCGGKCCFNVEMVRLYPSDIEYMQKSDQLKGLTRENILIKYTQLNLMSSYIPIGLIKMVEFGETSVCPFLNSIMYVKRGGKSIKDFNIHSICTLGQKNKPIICQLYPLSRITINNFELNENKKDMVFFLMDCPASETDKKVRIADFIGDYRKRTEENYKYLEFMGEVVSELKKRNLHRKQIETFMAIIGLICYAEESSMSEKFKKIRELLSKK